MKSTRNVQAADRKSTAAFTLVEIAISLAIIGFALVAIIGVLPIGMNVQKENREQTIINQDATVFVDAIRSGARGLDYLTNYVDAITNVATDFNPDGTIRNGPVFYGYTRTEWTINNVVQPPGYEIFNGHQIIGLLSTPKYTYWNVASQTVLRSNYITAYVRAISGLAAEKFPQDNLDVRDGAFTYRMISEVVPYTGWDTNWVQYNAPGLNPEEVVTRSNYWVLAKNLNANLHDIRLTFRWPFLPSGRTGRGVQIFRTMAGGAMTNEPPGTPTWFFQPQTFVKSAAP